MSGEYDRRAVNGEYDRGVFEGQVIARLDALFKLADDIKTCQTHLKDRLAKLEQAEVKLKTFAAMCGTLASLCIAVLMKWLFK